jgi:hypothetical protein
MFVHSHLSTLQVFLMERLYMRRELYFSIVLDRTAGGPIIVASTCGGTSIEDVAARSPELIIKVRPLSCCLRSGPCRVGRDVHTQAESAGRLAPGMVCEVAWVSAVGLVTPSLNTLFEHPL